MSVADKVFWVALTIFGGLFGGGLIMLFESGHWIIALIVTLVGLAGLLFLVRERWGGGFRPQRDLIANVMRAIAEQIAPQNTDAPAVADASLFNEDSDVMVHRLQFYTHLDVSGDPKLTGNGCFIDFVQPMINASVFSVEFEKEIEGRVFIDGEEQKDKLEIRETPLQVLKVNRANRHQLVFRQWLSIEVAKKIAEQSETIFDFEQTAVYFTFEHRGDKSRVRKALGNQVVWKNTRPELQAASG